MPKRATPARAEAEKKEKDGAESEGLRALKRLNAGTGKKGDDGSDVHVLLGEFRLVGGPLGPCPLRSARVVTRLHLSESGPLRSPDQHTSFLSAKCSTTDSAL